ncbi:hypothetical protein [Pseudomonas lactis]|uniref:hypothetical protein n=1 Tax=Pseudomonas lactis TaxID=1615674 RepID=UPI00190A51E0|nr:hypothetical protein [Pseudomonas lactis]MBK3442466.1 hypothetical protein [Pseudomonas lactis]
MSTPFALPGATVSNAAERRKVVGQQFKQYLLSQGVNPETVKEAFGICSQGIGNANTFLEAEENARKHSTVPGQQLHQREDPQAALKRGRIARLCTKCIRTRPFCVENRLGMLIDNQSTPLPRLFSPCLAFARRHFVQSLSDGHDISLLNPRSGASAHDRPGFRLHFYLVTKSLFAWYQQKRVVQCDIPRLAPR